MHVSWKFSALSVAVLAGASFITGCSVTSGANQSNPVQPSAPSSAPAFRGVVNGGQWPIKGAAIYLLAASQITSPVSPDTGYGDQSTSLISSSPNPAGLHGWFYVLTDTTGAFSIPSGTWSCTSGQQVYLYSVGGDTIDQNTINSAHLNTAAGQMVVLGQCGTSNSLPNIQGTVQMNEITTVAAAYALSGFAKDATDISSPATGQGYLGIQNAVKNAALLADLNTGNIPSGLPANVTVPSAMIYTLADILADCINQQNSTATECTRLMSDETYNGAQPGDTASAAINMAKQPGANVPDLYNNMLADQVWGGYITGGPPTDFAIGIGYSGGGLNIPTAIAIDASGNAWITDTPATEGAVIKLGPQGSVLSGMSGYACGTDLLGPAAIALGPSTLTPETAWVVSTSATVTGVPDGGGTCTALRSPEDHTDSTGWNNPISIAAGSSLFVLDEGQKNLDEFSLGSGSATWAANWQGFSDPDAIALDGAGDVWVANLSSALNSPANINVINSGGTNLLASSSAPLGLSTDYMAVGANQNLWVADPENDDAIPFTTTVSTNSASATAGTPFTDPTGGIGNPLAVAVDGVGNAWVLNLNGADIASFSAGGTTLSPDGSGVNTAPFGGYSGNGIVMPSSSSPTGIAVDPSGDVWVSVQNGNSPVVEFIGMAAPTVTPLADAAAGNKIAKLP